MARIALVCGDDSEIVQGFYDADISVYRDHGDVQARRVRQEGADIEKERRRNGPSNYFWSGHIHTQQHGAVGPRDQSIAVFWGNDLDDNKD
ncbi:hypothetical protein ACROYT_G043747 [Oculina patagonica]